MNIPIEEQMIILMAGMKSLVETTQALSQRIKKLEENRKAELLTAEARLAIEQRIDARNDRAKRPDASPDKQNGFGICNGKTP
jgi:hypothetical protein